MNENKREHIRKEYSEEIGFESMLAGSIRDAVVLRSGSTMDISHGGLGLVTSYRPAEGEVVRLSIPLKDPEVTLPVFAEVIWVEPFNEYYRAGLRFLA